MTLIAVVEIEHQDLALGQTIRNVPEASIQVVPHSGTDPDTGMFFFMVEHEDDDFDTVEAQFDHDPTVEEWTRIADDERTRIYRLQHTPGTKLLTPEATKVGGFTLEAKSTSHGWRTRLQLPDREAISRLWDYCREEGISFELVQMYQQEGISLDGKPLTEPQRTTLLAAYERGYFDEPRGTSHKEIAELLGISPTAVGGRIRRGTARLIEMVLTDDIEEQ
ncbi:helix-turn-helix domain-containing protein [Salinigranum salinum]|uniref:helix-turn-helix domain-containing protein n=1 Tax=Salinigranum salinum TaxID=1364937 RepID=UPI001260DF79|nr:helix-turn-helix domain-containing protein [Salinigranum salinum]